MAYQRAEGMDAIHEYSTRLVAAIKDTGSPATYRSDGLAATRSGAAPPWVILQYNPFSYGRWGFAPSLVSDVYAVQKRLAPRPFALMVHEAWVDVHDAKSALIGGYQRVQLRCLTRRANIVMATTQSMAHDLGTRSVHVPVASNIDPVNTSYETARVRLRIGSSVVIALFGRSNPSRALAHAEAAVDAIGERIGRENLLVMNLGADAPALRVHPDTHVLTPGGIDAVRLSLHLRASDLMLLPFTDGLTTRRTTLMAALAHGVPVLGLRGRATDDVLVRHQEILGLTPLNDIDAYSRTAAELANNPGMLRCRGESGRRLYVEEFDWPHVARRVMAAMSTSCSPTARSSRA